MALTRDTIEQMAPDQASLSAAIKLLRPNNWPVLARNGDTTLLWGECQGSGATPYRVVVSPEDAGYKCTCPSRKFPCKHSLAVMLMSCDGAGRFAEGATPDWVGDWLSRRRGKVSSGPPSSAAGDGPAKVARSLADAMAAAEVEKVVDPKAEARADAQRKRLREEREAAVLSGLDDLDRWIADELNAGLAGFAQRAAGATRTLSTRLVDSKAQGLAARLDGLAAEVYRIPEQLRGDRVLERLGALTLIAAAYRNQGNLPAPLKADVRRTVGWSVKREELLADVDAPRVNATWIVAATRSEVQPDKLRRLETWLMNASAEAGQPRFALLIEFVPVSAGASGLPFAAGEVLSGEVVFYPSAVPLRGLMASRASADEATPWPQLAGGLGAGLARYDEALARLPWIEFWPLACSGLSVRQIEGGNLALADGAELALPIDRLQTETVLPLVGLEAISAVFTWDGTFATLLAADTAIGRWYEE